MEPLSEDEVRVFVARPDDVDLDAAAAALTPEERAWIATFRFERNQREHLVSRALVRTVLSLHAPRTAPDAWRFLLGAHGKPSVAPPCGLSFNASNHPRVVVCAIARHDELGVDVEPLSRGDEIISVAETVFSGRERAALFALEGDAQRRRAVLLWTVKEAYIKGIGAGFSAPVREIEIDLDASPPSLSVPASFDAAEGWHLDVRVHEDACIGIAVRGPRARPSIAVLSSPLSPRPSG